MKIIYSKIIQYFKFYFNSLYIFIELISIELFLFKDYFYYFLSYSNNIIQKNQNNYTKYFDFFIS